MQLLIKNMVCNRCITAVQTVLEKQRINYADLQLGVVSLHGLLPLDQRQLLQQELSALGFELLDDARQGLVQQIKTAVIEAIHYGGEDRRYPFSEQLSKRLQKDYSYLSRLFSEAEGLTIEQYVLRQKAERVKELLLYGEKSLSEIAFDMGYSSVAHLSAQFKKLTGFTPSYFKSQHGERKGLDQV